MERKVDVRPLVLLRIFVPMMVFFDLLRLVQLDLVTVLFRPYEVGGLSTFTDPSAFIHNWSPMWAGPVAVGVTMVCMVLISLGRWMRPAIILGCFAYAQLGHVYPPGDRAIDRILRCVLLIILFTQADQKWAWNKKERVETIPAWPVDLIKWMLVMIYMSAGMSKMLQQPGWLAIDGMPVLFRIMTDPLASNHAPESLVWAYPLFIFWRLGNNIFRVFRLSSIDPLVPLVGDCRCFDACGNRRVYDLGNVLLGDAVDLPDFTGALCIAHFGSKKVWSSPCRERFLVV